MFYFGEEDLVICQDSNFKSESYSRLGYSYKLVDGMKKDSLESRSYLSGSESFRTLEIEAYKVFFWFTI